jgi:hypothetical protein
VLLLASVELRRNVRHALGQDTDVILQIFVKNLRVSLGLSDTFLDLSAKVSAQLVDFASHAGEALVEICLELRPQAGETATQLSSELSAQACEAIVEFRAPSSQTLTEFRPKLEEAVVNPIQGFQGLEVHDVLRRDPTIVTTAVQC